MPPTIVQLDEVFSTSASETVTFATPLVEGNLLVTFLLSANPAQTRTGFLIDGLPRALLPGLDETITGTAGCIITRIDRCLGGEQVLRVQVGISSTPWLLIYQEISDEAQLLPYVVTDRSDTFDIEPAPLTPDLWDADDLGVVYGLVVANPTLDTEILEPAGWTLLSNPHAAGRAFAVGYRAITVTGAQAEEDYTGDPLLSGSWLSVVLPLYDLGLRVRTALAVAANGGGQITTPGRGEPPVPVTPFQPAVNPLPPDPTPVVVPLPPWVPTPGQPYRRP